MSNDAAQPLLTVDGLHKAFGSTVACRGITFDLWPGEVIGIVDFLDPIHPGQIENGASAGRKGEPAEICAGDSRCDRNPLPRGDLDHLCGLFGGAQHKHDIGAAGRIDRIEDREARS